MSTTIRRLINFFIYHLSFHTCPISQKDEVMESLSITLLRLRDGKTRGLKKKGVLAQIVKGGYFLTVYCMAVYK